MDVRSRALSKKHGCTQEEALGDIALCGRKRCLRQFAYWQRKVVILLDFAAGFFDFLRSITGSCIIVVTCSISWKREVQ